MPFKRFVETGRVACISGGRYCGRLCSIVDVIDQTRVLVDGPATGVPRVPVRLNQLRLTKYLVKFPFKGSTSVVRKAWADSGILEKWKGGQWSGNLAKRRVRRHLSDFDRFKLRHARKARNALRTKEYCRLLKVAKRRKERLRKASAKWRISQKAKKTGTAPPAAEKPKEPKPKKLKKKPEAGKTKAAAGKAKTTAAKPKTAKPAGKAAAKPAAKQPAQKPKAEKSGAKATVKK